MAPISQRVALATGVTLTAYQAGSGPDMLLLHGTGDGGMFWSVQIDQFAAAGYRVTAIDGRGHGTSDRARDYSTAAIVADALALIDALQLHRPIVIGQSMGGVQALNMAVNHPTHVACAILEDPALLAEAWGDTLIIPARAAWRHELDTWAAMRFDELVAFKRSDTPRWSDEVITQWAYTKMHEDPNVLQWLDELRVPIWSWVKPTPTPIHMLYCAPRDGDPSRVDGVITPALAAALQARVPTLSAEIVPDAGHYIRHDQPAAFLQAILAYLQRQSLLP